MFDGGTGAEHGALGLDNAIDAASDRGRTGWVRLTLASGPGGWLRINVRDNGPGITTEPVELVFMPRVTTKGDGRGFGLALVRDAVNRLQGRIIAYNDGGAVFDVRIPEPREQEEE